MTDKKESLTKQFADLLATLEERDSFHVDAAKVELAEQIFQAMENKDVTEAELSRRLNVSRAYINKILQGNVNFTIETLVKIACALNYRFDFQFVDKKAEADALDAEVVYKEMDERTEQILIPRSLRRGYVKNNVYDIAKFKLNKRQDFEITDTEVYINNWEENYAPRENAA